MIGTGLLNNLMSYWNFNDNANDDHKNNKGSIVYDWKGKLDEIGIWRNRILSQDDAKLLYNDGNGLKYNNYRY